MIMTMQERLDAYDACCQALGKCPGESLYDAAQRVRDSGVGRVDLALILAPEIDEVAWQRIARVAKLWRTPTEVT